MKTKERKLKCIPTVYNGIQLKSRMESKVALLLDKLGWAWEYEPFSVMLDGINYTPDFYIREHGYVIECRGYDSNLGNKQIARFGDKVYGSSGLDIPGYPISHYAVFGPNRVVCPQWPREFSWPEPNADCRFIAAMPSTGGAWTFVPGVTPTYLRCTETIAGVEVNVRNGEVLLDMFLFDNGIQLANEDKRLSNMIAWANEYSCDKWSKLPLTKNGSEEAIICYRCAVASKVAEEAGYDDIADAFFHAKRTSQWSDENARREWKISVCISTDEFIYKVISSIAFLAGISDNELVVLPPGTSEDGGAM